MLKSPKLVEISWIDSENWKSGWDYIEDVVKHYTAFGHDVMRSLGYIIGETDECVMLAGDLQFNESWGVSRANRICSIPKVCILKIKKVDGIGKRS